MLYFLGGRSSNTKDKKEKGNSNARSKSLVTKKASTKAMPRKISAPQHEEPKKQENLEDQEKMLKNMLKRGKTAAHVENLDKLMAKKKMRDSSTSREVTEESDVTENHASHPVYCPEKLPVNFLKF